jgi:hypothetical protein
MDDWFAARLQEKGETGSSSPGVYIKKEPSEEESRRIRRRRRLRRS